MKRNSLSLLAAALFIMALTSGTHADQFKTPESSTPQEVVGGMSKKLVRGVANVATGWAELPKQIAITFQEDGVASGIFVGPLKGIGMTVVRTVSGAGEIATFFIPFPGFYDPFFEPEYVWEKE
jgi:putative exosortase-associated protein (TIGR04073 family)